LLFFNVDLFKQRVRQTFAKSDQPLHLFIFDMVAISVIGITGLGALEEVRSELTAKGSPSRRRAPKPSCASIWSAQVRGSTLVQRTFIRRYEARYSLR
jgi:hypothetical protein